MLGKKYINSKGITLIELIVTLAVLGIVFVPLGTMFITNYVSYYKDSAKINATSDMRFALNSILENLRSADQNSIKLQTEQKIIFEISDESSTYNGSVWYDSDEKCIMLKNKLGERKLLKNVTYATMKYANDERISITITSSTNLPFSSPFIYTQTYDYRIRYSTLN